MYSTRIVPPDAKSDIFTVWMCERLSSSIEHSGDAQFALWTAYVVFTMGRSSGHQVVVSRAGRYERGSKPCHCRLVRLFVAFITMIMCEQ